MNYCGINYYDIANGPGVRVSLFVSGCRNHCPGCFQPETWAFDYGKPFTQEVKDRIIEAMRNPYCKGLTILGGDPMEPENLPEVLELCRTVSDIFGYDRDIWVYTGYTIEALMERMPITDLAMIDVLVDGPFVEEKKVIGKFRGSSNQRFIDISETIWKQRLCYWREPGGEP